MQGIDSIGGGGDRYFGGGGGGDRRLRPNHQNQSVKCPRCDSLNTKFCYYNNYNLSQPRHFCKSCRRYWTKGGVLRNVPVGGGCRKTKRFKAKQSPDTQPDRKSNSNSGSESSGLTVTAAGEAKIDAGPGSRVFVPQSTYTIFEHVDSESEIAPEIGGFTCFTKASNDQTDLNFKASDISPFNLNEQQLRQDQQQLQLPKISDEMTATFLDQTLLFDLPRTSNGEGFTLFDWQAGEDPGLYEFTETHQANWNQNYHDHPLFLP